MLSTAALPVSPHAVPPWSGVEHGVRVEPRSAGLRAEPHVGMRHAPRLILPPGRPLPLLPTAPRLRIANIFEPPWIFVLMLLGIVTRSGLSTSSASSITPAALAHARPIVMFCSFMLMWQLVLHDIWDALTDQVSSRKKIPGVDVIAKLPGLVRYTILVLVFVVCLSSLT